MRRAEAARIAADGISTTAHIENRAIAMYFKRVPPRAGSNQARASLMFATLAGCANDATLQLFDLLETEHGLLLAADSQMTSIDAFDADGFAHRLPFATEVQIATLGATPAELGLSLRVAPGDPATDTRVADLALRSFSAPLQKDSLGPWTEGAPGLDEFVLPIPRPRCSSFKDDFTLESIPFETGRIVGLATALADGSLLIGAGQAVERVFRDGTHHPIDHDIPLDASHGREQNGRLTFTSGTRLVEGTLDDRRLTLTPTHDWGTATSTRAMLLLSATDGAYVMTRYGEILRVDHDPPELLWSYSRERVIRLRRGSLVEHPDRSVLASFSGSTKIVTIHGSTADVELPDVPTAPSSLAALADGQLLVGDGFGEFWTSSGGSWTHLDDHDGFALAVNALENHGDGVIIGADKGQFGELDGGTFCTRERVLVGNIRFVRLVEQGVFVIAQTTDVSPLDVAFFESL